MSDPMTNTEVEDVLASIRRLVSDDHRSEPVAKDTTASDRLVLTPALRVMDDSAPEDETDAAETDEYSADSAAPDGDAVEDIDDEHSPEVALTEEPSSVHNAETAQDSIALDDVDLENQTLMSIQDAFDRADEAEAEAVSQQPLEAADTGHADEEQNAEHEETAEASDEQMREVREEQGATEAETLSEKIAALETLIAGQTEEFEPDLPGDGAYAGTEAPTIEWEDAEETEDNEVFDSHEDSEVDDAQVFASDEDVLDEDALRDLVSDIVREELQGALGERITRNVRKLVRREIHRALAAQDLE
ncbi:MAG: hypothetical protein AB3N09_03950 [Tateyamaria sp.]